METKGTDKGADCKKKKPQECNLLQGAPSGPLPAPSGCAGGMQQGGGGSWPLTRVCSSNSPPLLWARGLGPRSVLSSLEPGFADRAPGSERVPEVPGVTQAIRCPRFPPDAWTVTPLGDPCLGNPVSRGSPDPRRGPIQGKALNPGAAALPSPPPGGWAAGSRS